MNLNKYLVSLLLVSGISSSVIGAEGNRQEKKPSKLSFEVFSDHSKFSPHKSIVGGDTSQVRVINRFSGVGVNYQLNDDLALIAKLGNLASHVIIKDGDSKIKSKLPTIGACKLGARYRILDSDGFALFAEPSVLVARRRATDLEETILRLDVLRTLTKRARLCFWGVSGRLIVEKKLGATTPYVGIQYQRLSEKTVEKLSCTIVDRDQNQKENLPDQVNKSVLRLNKKNMGMVLGVRHALSDRSTFKVEGRFINEKALCAELSFSF